ncbi:MAG: MotA/TolQ/ExbB proton channel family protein [Bacteroidia bacterium]|nr:MotA/TolQ/ExbB proton channel family protein [Bacteroidia bacterium]
MVMAQKKGGLKEALQTVFASSSIVISLIIGFLVWHFVMGNPVNFEGGASLIANKVPRDMWKPIPGNYLSMIYKGGYIVPLLMTCILVLITFTVERFVSIGKANGKGKLNLFVANIRDMLASNQIDEAKAACDKQKGSLANVIRAGLHRYKDLQADPHLQNDQKVLSLQKELEEAAALELPMLSKNLVILSTLASICVLIGLIGTVLGMIRAFAALAQAGAPDALALATGISEALINTAFGITGSTIALIMFNFFTTKVDSMTYKIDEANFSITQTFAANLKN